MAPKKQVSPAIRILRGERDVSARATHLEAATRKFLVTTNERKQMSTKTNFKRIALVAVASLGLGVLSSVPSQAQILTTVNIVTVAGTSATNTGGAITDSATAATAGLTFLSTHGGGIGLGDSVVVSSFIKSAPAGASLSNVTAEMLLVDTGIAGQQSTVDTNIQTNDGQARPIGVTVTSGAAVITTLPAAQESISTFIVNRTDTATSGYANANFKVILDTAGGGQLVAGTYVVSLVATPYDNGAVTLVNTKAFDVNIVVSALASAALTAVAGNSSAVLYAGSTFAVNNTVDSTVAAVATASTTAAAQIRVILKNAANAANAKESVTVTTTLGTVGTGGSGAYGRSVVLAYSGSSLDIDVRPDGSAGIASITISTPSVTFAPKQVTFYAVAPSKLTITTPTPLLKVGTNDDAVRVTAVDANGITFAGTLYSYATVTTVAGTVRTALTTCTFDNGTDQRHECSITGTSAGTATITISNYGSAADATAAANGAEISGTATVVVSSPVIAGVKIEFDKSTYFPGERARIYVTPTDSAGKAMPAAAHTNVLATGGISTSSALTFAGSTTTADSLTAVSVTTKANASSTTGARAGSMEYTVFMPLSGGTVTLTATGGTGLPSAGRVVTTATATITDSGAAALAAVNALATTVASLKTLITTLTNLVLKIQKKVKA